MNSSVSIRWSPHSTPDNQRFLKINSTQQELCLYDLAHEVCPPGLIYIVLQ